MSINLAEDAIHALNRAAVAAARDGEDAIAPAHILAGTISQQDPDLLLILGRIDLDPESLPEAMRTLPETYEGHLPFTATAHEVLGAAVGLAAGHGGGPTTSAHLLLGVAQAGDTGSRSVLGAWGLDESALDRELRPDTSGVGTGE